MVNHEELVAELSKALYKISTVLPTIQGQFELYQNDEMVGAAEMLYLHLTTFFARALQWYTEGKLKHILKAFVQPYPLRFKDLMEKIDSCAQTIQQQATSSAQFEQRKIHMVLKEIREMLALQQKQNGAFNDKQSAIHEIVHDHRRMAIGKGFGLVVRLDINGLQRIKH